MIHTRSIALPLLLLAATATARTLDVAPGGDDSADGSEAAPLATLARAVALAKPGDTIRLDPAKPYHDQLKIKDFRGTPEAPLVIDGRGATLIGTEPLDPADWTENAGVFESKTFYAKIKASDTTLLRYFFVFGDKQQRMGRSVKGPKVSWRNVDALAEGEWTVKDQTFYLKPPAGMTPAQIQAPVRDSGVAIAGASNYVTVRNLAVERVWNDGFNIHGQSKAIRFENIKATEVGDDGLSAHEECEVEIDGFIATRNGTGVCQVNRVISTMKNAEFIDNVAYDYGGLHATKNVLENSKIVRTIGGTAITLGSGGTDSAEMNLKSVRIEQSGDTKTNLLVRKGSALTADDVTLAGISVRIDGSANWKNSTFSGGKRVTLVVSPDATWTAQSNQYDIGPITFKGTRQASVDAFKEATGEAAAK